MGLAMCSFVSKNTKLNFECNWEGLYDESKLTRIIIISSYSFCLSTLILKVIHNC